MNEEFRKELVKIMPGYAWTVHQSRNPEAYLTATGIMSSGFNRLSTLYIVRRNDGKGVEYEVRSSGFGKNAPWLSTASDGTLARALRTLQTHYESNASIYRGHAGALQNGRKKRSPR